MKEVWPQWRFEEQAKWEWVGGMRCTGAAYHVKRQGTHFSNQLQHSQYLSAASVSREHMRFREHMHFSYSLQGLPLQTCKMIDTAPNSTSLRAHLFGIVNLKLRWLPVCGVLRSWSRDGTPLTAVFLQFCVPWWRLQYSSRNIGNWKILWLELEKLINHEN